MRPLKLLMQPLQLSFIKHLLHSELVGKLSFNRKNPQTGPGIWREPPVDVKEKKLRISPNTAQHPHKHYLIYLLVAYFPMMHCTLHELVKLLC